LSKPARTFVNLPIDFLLIGGGSMIVFAVLPFFQDGSRTMRVAEVGMWLTWVANWPHFSATMFRLYGRWDHLKQYPITAIGAPLIVMTGAVTSLLWPLAVAPFFVKLFLLWSPFHYCGQSLGISLIYARRGGHQPRKIERFFLAAFIYGTFLMRALASEVGTGGTNYYGVHVPGFGVPRLGVTLFTVWTYACAAIVLGVLAHDFFRHKKRPPALYLLPAAAQYVWFALAGQKPGYAEFVPFFHGLQYLVIAWAMQIAMRFSDTPATRPAIARESLRWYALNAAGGVALFYLLPHGVARAGVDSAFATAIVLTAVQIHHFFVDGVIWKLKSQKVVSPLLVNIPELARRAPLRVAA
jgi:hypothetical protein